MLAYRHAFHAGNHADVLKHLVLVQVLRYLGEKDKPYWLIDTHAGAGAYKLQSRHAQQNAEFENGISRLWGRDDLPPAVADYVDLVRAHNPGGTLKHYPGSPALALQLLRPQDRLRLWELHPTDLKLLAQHFDVAAAKIENRLLAQHVHMGGRRGEQHRLLGVPQGLAPW